MYLCIHPNIYTFTDILIHFYIYQFTLTLLIPTPLKLGTKARYFCYYQHFISQCNQTIARNQRYIILGKINSFLLTDCITTFLKRTRESVINLTHIIQKFNTVANYKVSMCKSIHFIHTNNNQSEDIVEFSLLNLKQQQKRF